MNSTPVLSSLEHLAVLAAQGQDFSFLLGDFLDGVYRLPKAESLQK